MLARIACVLCLTVASVLAQETTRVNVDSAGNQGNGSSGGTVGAGGASISADGRHVAFRSGASNLVPGDTNGADDIFVHDRQTGETTRVSVDSSGNQGNKYSWRVSISADGRFIAFHSHASNLSLATGRPSPGRPGSPESSLPGPIQSSVIVLGRPTLARGRRHG